MNRVSLLAVVSLLLLGACGGGGSQPVVLGESPPAPPPPVQPPPSPPPDAWPEPSLATPTTPVTTVAQITESPVDSPRSAPCVVHVHAVASTLAAGEPHTARYRWKVAGPPSWQPPTAPDPRPGLQAGQTISLDRDCEGFNFALVADVPGRYTIGLEVWDEAGAVAVDRFRVEVGGDTRVALHVAANGDDANGDGTEARPFQTPARAWAHVVANGRRGFRIRLRRGDTFVGFANNSDNEGEVHDLVIDAYGAGSDPIVRWTSTYTEQRLCRLWRCESVLVQSIKFLPAAGSPGGIAVEVTGQPRNVSFVDCTFGTDSEFLGYCVLVGSTDPRTEVLASQGSGFAFVNCVGRSSAYFCYANRPDTGGAINGASVTPTPTTFECSPGRLALVDGAYDGMEVIVRAGTLARNERRRVQSYVANGGNGRPRFTLSTGFTEAPNAGDELWIVDIDQAGFTDFFFFGGSATAASGQGTEARVRLINARRASFVGFTADGSTSALQQKDTLRLMVEYASVYRCANLNSLIAAGADVGADGIGPFRYQVYDRSYLKALDRNGGIPIIFSVVDRVHVRGCVLSGNLAVDNNYLLQFAFDRNSGIYTTDVRFSHTSMWTRQNQEGIVVGVPAAKWPDDFVTIENCLVVRDHVGSEDFLYDRTTPTRAWKASRGNLFCPDQDVGFARAVFSAGPNDAWTMAQWNQQSWVDRDAYGSIDIDTLLSTSFVPPVGFATENTHRNFTSKGVYQDYYGQSPIGHTMVGAVAAPTP